MTSAPLTVDTLAARYRGDAAASGAGSEHAVAERRLAAALNKAGWRAASDAPASEVARELVFVLEACLSSHRDLPRLRRELASRLRAHAHVLDGGGASVAEWEPTASQLLAYYLRDADAAAPLGTDPGFAS